VSTDNPYDHEHCMGCGAVKDAFALVRLQVPEPLDLCKECQEDFDRLVDDWRVYRERMTSWAMVRTGPDPRR